MGCYNFFIAWTFTCTCMRQVWSHGHMVTRSHGHTVTRPHGQAGRARARSSYGNYRSGIPTLALWLWVWLRLWLWVWLFSVSAAVAVAVVYNDVSNLIINLIICVSSN